MTEGIDRLVMAAQQQSAGLSGPHGTTFDSKGAMCIADDANGAVRKVIPGPWGRCLGLVMFSTAIL
jgi:hypothetical protein